MKFARVAAPFGIDGVWILADAAKARDFPGVRQATEDRKGSEAIASLDAEG